MRWFHPSQLLRWKWFLAIPIILSACGLPIQTTEEVLFPSQMWTFYKGSSDDATYSCFPFVCMISGGTGPAYTSPPGHITVGYDYRYDNGTSPCNCWSYVDHAYRGAVLFDTSKMPKLFALAWLVLTPVTVKNDNPVNPLHPDAGVIGGLFAPSKPWSNVLTNVITDVNGTDTANVEVTTYPAKGPFVIAPFPKDPTDKSYPVTRVGDSYRIDVTSRVRSWVKNEIPNNGFMLVGKNENLPGKGSGATSVVIYKATLLFLHGK